MTLCLISAHRGCSSAPNCLKTKRRAWSSACQPTELGGSIIIIIFVLTFAIMALFALALTGSIASGHAASFLHGFLDRPRPIFVRRCSWNAVWGIEVMFDRCGFLTDRSDA